MLSLFFLLSGACFILTVVFLLCCKAMFSPCHDIFYVSFALLDFLGLYHETKLH